MLLVFIDDCTVHVGGKHNSNNVAAASSSDFYNFCH